MKNDEDEKDEKIHKRCIFLLKISATMTFSNIFYCFLSQKDFSVQLTLPIKQLLSTGNDKECLKANN